MINFLPSKPGFSSLCGYSLCLWIHFLPAHKQQIFMDSTKQKPLTSGLWLFVRGPGRDGRVEDIEAKVFVPQISPLGVGRQWLVSGPLPSFLQQFKFLKPLITLAPLSPILHCFKSNDASVVSFNPALGSVNSLSISHVPYVPCWEVTNAAL